MESRLVATRGWGRGNEKLKSVSCKLWAGLNGAIFPCWGQDPCLLHMETQENKLKISKKLIILDLNYKVKSSSIVSPVSAPTNQAVLFSDTPSEHFSV